MSSVFDNIVDLTVKEGSDLVPVRIVTELLQGATAFWHGHTLRHGSLRHHLNFPNGFVHCFGPEPHHHRTAGTAAQAGLRWGAGPAVHVYRETS